MYVSIHIKMTLAQRLIMNAKSALLIDPTIISLIDQIVSQTVSQITDYQCIWMCQFKYVEVGLKLELKEPIIQLSPSQTYYTLNDQYQAIIRDQFNEHGFIFISGNLKGTQLVKVTLSVN